MEELSALIASGKIYDGCTVRAIGTVRFRNGEVYIESMRNLVDIGGANFEKLCRGEVECAPPSTNSLVVEDKRPMSEIDKEMLTLKKQLREANEKNGLLNQELFKSLLLIESLTKQLDTDQTFATNTILDLTNTIMDLKNKLKEASESSELIHSEIEQLRKADSEHRTIISSLQADKCTFEGAHATSLARVLAEQQAEKFQLEQQINSLCEELKQKNAIIDSDSASSNSTTSEDLASSNGVSPPKKSKSSKLRRLFGSSKKLTQQERQTQLPIGAHRGNLGNAAH